MDAALKAIAEPRRREILRLVWDGEISSGEIAAHFDVSGPAVSQHLKVLREAGLVNERREGTRHLFAVQTDGFAVVREFLDGFWPSHLAALKRAAERAARDHG